MNDTFESYVFEDDGYFPNHPYLPALIYRKVLEGNAEDCEKLLHDHQWSNTWVGDVFHYHHYHSRTHETLAVLNGAATLTLGGPNGKAIDVEKGDLLILPAGVGHKNEGATEDFQIMGAYPFGESFDLKTGEKHGPLMEFWNS